MLLGVMGNIADTDEAFAIVRRLVGALPSGSYLVLKDGTRVIRGEERHEALRALGEGAGFVYHRRTPDEIAGFFDGLELLDPGVVSTPRWRPSGPHPRPPAEVDEFGGVGRKP
jgi:hypothetical protein